MSKTITVQEIEEKKEKGLKVFEVRVTEYFKVLNKGQGGIGVNKSVVNQYDIMIFNVVTKNFNKQRIFPNKFYLTKKTARKFPISVHLKDGKTQLRYNVPFSAMREIIK